MKKLRFGLLQLFLLLLLSCSDNALMSVADEDEFTAGMRSYNEAIDIAQLNMAYHFPTDNEGRAQTRTTSKRNIKVIKKANSRSGLDENLMYVVNFDDNNGFVIVPCNENADEVIAVVPNGNYDPDFETDNDGFNYYMDAAADYLSIIPPMPRDTIGPLPLIPDTIVPPGPSKYELIWHFEGGPVLNQEWGQHHPYGWFCPNGISGCVSTAIATAMAYFHFQKGLPRTMVYNFPERDMDSQDIDWPEVLRHKKSVNDDSEFQDDICYAENKDYSHKTIARICREIGYEAHAVYWGSDGTGVPFELIKPITERFMPASHNVVESDFDYTTICKTIDRGIGIVYGYIQRDPTSESEYGHCWIADGYKMSKWRHTYYTLDYNGLWRFHDEISLNYMTYFKWGFNGEFDGYYSANAFKLPDGRNAKVNRVISITEKQ